MTKSAYIFGNGISRLNCKYTIDKNIVLFVCNLGFLHFKQYNINYIFYKEAKLLKEIKEQYTGNGCIVKAYDNLNSGESAAIYAANYLTEIQDIHLFGFDNIWESGIREINNVFLGHPNYPDKGLITSDEAHINYWKKVFLSNSHKIFYIRGCPEYFKEIDIKNVKILHE